MALDHLKIKSRSKLLLVACLGLLLMNVRNFITLSLGLTLTIALLALWLTVSALTFFFLTRRKPIPSASELN
jgi:hypothetical protein